MFFKIDEDSWNKFICELNYQYEVAEKISTTTVMETVMGCLTCYLTKWVSLCVPHFFKMELFPDRIVLIEISMSSTFFLHCSSSLVRIIFRLCQRPTFYKRLDEIAEFIDHCNRDLLIPRGLYAKNPIEKGFRVVSCSPSFSFFNGYACVIRFEGECENTL